MGFALMTGCSSSLPLYHINGQVIGTADALSLGGSIVAPHAFSVSSWWGDVEAYGCTWINMVPTIIAYLLNAAAGAPPRRFPQLRFGRSASAPLPPDHHRAFEASFGVPVIEGMGMTETASVTFCNPMHSSARKYGSVGLPSRRRGLHRRPERARIAQWRDRRNRAFAARM